MSGNARLIATVMRRKHRASARTRAKKRDAQKTRLLSWQKRRQVVPKAVLDALADMRRGATLSRAALDNGVSAKKIKRFAGSALVQERPGARVRVRKSDDLARLMQIPGPHGPREIVVHGSKTASEFARYKAAVNRFLAGDADALAPWHGKKIAGVELITAGNTLKSLAAHDLLPYSLYSSLSGGAA